jgi:hypothetical protein
MRRNRPKRLSLRDMLSSGVPIEAVARELGMTENELTTRAVKAFVKNIYSIHDRLTFSVMKGYHPLLVRASKEANLDLSKLMREGLQIYLKSNEQSFSDDLRLDFEALRKEYDLGNPGEWYLVF